MSGFRLSQGGRLINRDRPLRFHFDGRSFTGFEGDTLASALLAQGVRTIARSFKFHRPRGIRGAGWEDPNAFVRLLAPVCEANVLATQLRLSDGLSAASQHRWPSLGFDLGALADRLKPLLPAGFYYKTFKWPARAWPFYEQLIRRAAGLGALPDRASRLEVERRHAQAAVLVVGAGLAGAAAALAVVRSGRSLIWADDGDRPGGRLFDYPDDTVLAAERLPDGLVLEGETARQWLERARSEIDASTRATRLARTTVLSLHEHGEAIALERMSLQSERLWLLRVDRVVLAAGAFELPSAFEDNDRPGIMLAGAVGHYLDRHAVACGRRAVLAGPEEQVRSLARALRGAGVEVAAIVDPRPPATDGRPAPASSSATDGVPVLRGWRVRRAIGRSGLEAVRIEPADRATQARSPIGASGQSVGPGDRIDCDLLAVHGGWSPALQLARQAAGTGAADGSVDWVWPVGAARAHDGPESCIGDGWQRVVEMLGDIARGPCSSAPRRPERSASAIAPPTVALPAQMPEGLAAQRVFIDCASDVTALDIALAQREGYEAPELLKRYTTLGMGPDQGRGTGPLGIDLLARHRGIAPGHLEPTRARPPFVPVAFGTLAGVDPGALIRPLRETPLSAWHREAGAVMYESGANWRRPGYYPQVGESFDQALRRECRAVREAVGLYDSSPLAKYEISGPQAEVFLERLLPSRVGTLKPGRGRYALMLREDGRLLDDGVIFRLASDRFWLTGTAGNADAVQAWLDYARQWLFRDLRQVIVAPVSAQWATIVVCGPRARELLLRLGTDLDPDPAAFPFMAVRVARVADFEARVFRVSFTGELSYELNVRPRDALALWLRLLDEGRDLGIEPIGSEANHVLRIEKGFVSIGHEADGIANPDDLGLGWAVHLDKGDFVGRRSILRDRASALPRAELVGLEVADGPALEEGAQIVGASVRLGIETGPAAPRSEGFVTASVDSIALGRPIALALLERGRGRIGESVQVTLTKPGAPERGHAGLGLRTARVVAPVFYDPEGVRLRG